MRQKCPADSATLAGNADLQDIVVLNLSRAVQICVDLAVHALSARNQPAPDTMGQAFDLLTRIDDSNSRSASALDPELALRMKKAVGFRNLAVHSYAAIDWTIVHAIATRHLVDFEDFARAIDEFG